MVITADDPTGWRCCRRQCRSLPSFGRIAPHLPAELARDTSSEADHLQDDHYTDPGDERDDLPP